MKNFTESDIELFTIELLEKLKYQYIYALDIAPDGEKPERKTFEDVLLIERLTEAVGRINPKVPAEARDEAVKLIQRLNSPELIANNETFHRMLTEGITVTYQKDGNSRGDLVWLIDFNNPDNNDFIVANQFTVTSTSTVTGTINKRPDVILFINGIPLVVIELKNAVDENATIRSAFKQIQTYKQFIPSLFTYNGFVVISDGLEAKAGTISAGFSRFMAWKSVDGKKDESHLVSELETLIKGMLNKKTLLDLLRHFIVFEKTKREDLKTNLTVIETTKKLAAYHQYYAVNKAVDNTILASSVNGTRKGGVVWHTQGSGKSLSMVFYTGKLVLALDNPTILVITDRNDLDDQLFDTFAASKQLLRQDPVQAENRSHLKDLLKVASGGVVFSTIQKFQPDASTSSASGAVYEQLSNRKNIVVIADEAHRTQYGFKAKTIDDKDEKGNIIGKKTVYGFAKYMRDALPNATFLGFTGTPIESTDVNTPAVFGNYIDVYDIAQAVEDGATVRIYYEGRLAKINLSEEGRKLVKELDDELVKDDLTDNQQAIAKWTQLEALVGSEDRIKHIAADIVTHFQNRQEVFEGKGMIVSMSRRIAVELYNEIIKLKPEWHSDDLKKGTIKVVMTASSSDGPEMAKHHTTKDQRRILSDRMKSPEDELKLVIVRDMWLTGFDVPSLHTLYIDKPMRGHNLMQAIARVNRVYKDKPGGLIVDYLGIASDLKQALSFYSDSGGKGDPAIAQEKAVQLMLEKLEVVSQMFLEKPSRSYSKEYEDLVKDPSVPYLGKDRGLLYEEYFTADTTTKLKIILAAEEHILSLENGKKRFVDEVTALSRAFAIAIPHEQAMDVKDEVSFFQAIKARLAKFDITGSGKTDDEIETTIRQVIDKALVTEKVIDIFDAAGIKKPDISILSEDFLLEVKNMEHKNVALEVLRKLLNDEIKSRTRTNLVQGKSLMEMLENSIKKYLNKILTAAEVIEELIKLGKEIKEMDKEPKAMGLSEFEYAFYTAVANNESARELMQKDKLRELAIVLFDRVRQNASIDWTIKESVKAKLKVIVKRTLRQYGYPPDMQKLATETILKQAELIANELTN
ncbi:MAG: type I restriction endonuclease subunit R [Melioribacteraceae bacterium]|nr:type I restriction endonuclease subunit R [Melioribacteraceae bacterium]